MSHRDPIDRTPDRSDPDRSRRLAQWALLTAGVVGMAGFGVAARTDGIVFAAAGVLVIACALLAGAAGIVLCGLWPPFDRSDPPEENQP